MAASIERSLATEYILYSLQLIKQRDKLYLKIFWKDINIVIFLIQSASPTMHVAPLFSPL